MIEIKGNTLEVKFDKFGIEEYDIFKKCKLFPESVIEYDAEKDVYSVKAPSRFAKLLGLKEPKQQTSDLPLSSFLFDYQAYIVKQALYSKRYAVYADCGLGKTNCFLEFAKHVVYRTEGKVLILSPLQIIPQTLDEAKKFYGDTLPIVQLKTREELAVWCKSEGSGIGISNYEKMIPGKLPELGYLSGLILDESSLLKTGGGIIKWNLIKSSKGIEYKLSCTATPAPNDIMEYASQAAFLEKLRNEGEILWTYFTRDKVGNWTVKPHAKEGYYKFLSSWSIYIRRPAFYGFKDNTKSIPDPVLHDYKIKMTEDQKEMLADLHYRSGHGLFGEKKIGITLRSKLSQIAKGFIYKDGKKDIQRVESLKPAEVIKIAKKEVKAKRKVLIWTVFDEEGEILLEGLKGMKASQLHGRMKDSEQQALIESFRKGEIDILISKPKLLGYGLNLQICGAMIFNGWNDSYEQWYQAVRRAYRYGQTVALQIHVPVIPELEGIILDNILRKKDSFEQDANEQEFYYKQAMNF